MNNHLIEQVRRLKPGEHIHVDLRILNKLIPEMEYNGATFTSADRVLENIVGAAYEYNYREDYVNRCVIFYRLEKHVEYGQAYTSPDRRVSKQS